MKKILYATLLILINLSVYSSEYVTEVKVIQGKIIEEKTIYNIELIQELDGNHLEYEKENADFKLVEFE